MRIAGTEKRAAGSIGAAALELSTATTGYVAPCSFTHSSSGAAVTTRGQVLFTECSGRKIQGWNPQARRMEVWLANETPGMFGR